MIGHEEAWEKMRLANPAPTSDPDELAAVLSVIEERRDTMSNTPEVSPTDKRRETVTVPWYRRPVTAVALAAVAVFALIIPIALVGGGGGDSAGEDPTTTQPATTTTIPVTTAPQSTPATTVAPVQADPVMPVDLAMGWERAPAAAVFERAWMRAATAGGPGLVAVGSTERYGAAIWTSEDGIIWQRIEDPSLEAPDFVQDRRGPHERSMEDIAAGSAGIVAIGGDSSYIEGSEVDTAVVWYSPDGLDWSEIKDDAFDLAIVNAVVAGGPGFVAVGTAGEDGHLPAVWVSADGQAWDSIVDESLAAGPGYDFASLEDVTAGGPGLVAVGCEEPGAHSDLDPWEYRHPGIWVSVDGYAWERLPDDAVVDPQLDLQSPLGDGTIPAGIFACPASVVAGDDGLIALGDWGDRIWASSDGYTWTITHLVPPTSDGGLQLTALAADGDRLVGAGIGPSTEHADRGTGPPHYVSATFWSFEIDTATWYQVDSLEAIHRVGMVDTSNMQYSNPGVVDDVIPFAGGFIAVGHDGFYDTETNEELSENWCGLEGEWTGSCRTDAAVWIGTWETG